MMRVLSPKGKLFQVEKAVPVCEKRLTFNGEEMILMDVAKDFSVRPTAIALKLIMTGIPNDELIVGNLAPEKVVEIIRALADKGFYDFSGMPCQETDKLIKTVMDEGKSDIYSSETTEGDFFGISFTSGCCGPGFPVWMPKLYGTETYVGCRPTIPENDWNDMP